MRRWRFEHIVTHRRHDSDDPDELAERRVGRREAQGLTERVLAGKEAFGQQPIDNRDGFGRRIALFGLDELATRNERQTERREIAGADHGEGRVRRGAAAGHLLVDPDRAEWNHRCDACRANAGHCSHAIEDCGIRGPATCLIEAGDADIDFRQQPTRQREARIGARGVHTGADEYAGRGEQRHRQRNLSAHEECRR